MEPTAEVTTNSKPDRLPDSLSISGTWESILENLFSIFKKDFIDNTPHFQDKPVWFDRKIEDNYPKGFWHLIEKENKEAQERQLDIKRAEKTPWCAPTITNNETTEVLYWDYLEKNNKIHSYLWLFNFDYLVILNKKEFPPKNGKILKVAFIVSAFHTGERKKIDLKQKYKNRVV